MITTVRELSERLPKIDGIEIGDRDGSIKDVIHFETSSFGSILDCYIKDGKIYIKPTYNDSPNFTLTLSVSLNTEEFELGQVKKEKETR